MKRSIFPFAVAVCMAGSITTGCSDQQKMERAEKKAENARQDQLDAERDFAQAKQDSLMEWKRFEDDANTQIDRNKEQIAELRASVRKEDSKAAIAQQKRDIDALQKRNDELKSSLDDDMAKKDHKGWENFKAEFKHDMDELGHSISDLGKNNARDKK